MFRKFRCNIFGMEFTLCTIEIQPMKASGKFLKNALECMTQCVLLPGVELRFEEVLFFYAKNIETIIGKRIKH